MSGRRLDLALFAGLLALLLVLSGWPHAANARRAGDLVYLGFGPGPADHCVYLSWIEQARQGRVLFENLFRAEGGATLFPNLYFLSLGRVAAACGMDSLGVLSASRAVAIPLLAVAVWLLAGALASGPGARRLAAAWALLGSGLGCLIVPRHAFPLSGTTLEDISQWPWSPAELRMPELTPLASCMASSHLAFGLALMTLTAACGARARLGSSVAWLGAAIGGALALGYSHIYGLLVLLAITVALGARELARGAYGRALGHLAFVAAGSLPVLHHAVVFAADADLARWSQVALPSPSPTIYALAFGLAVPLCALGWRSREPVTQDDELVWTWIAVQAALLYSGPFIKFERRLCEGLWLPVTLVAASVLAARASRLGGPARAGVALLWVAAVLPTGLLFGWLLGQRDPAHPHFFRERVELAALAGLSRQLTDRDVVLATPLSGILIPGLAGRRVVLGQPDHTPGYPALAGGAERFFGGRMPPAEAVAFLRESQATHVLADTRAHALSLPAHHVAVQARAGPFVLFLVTVPPAPGR